MALRELKHHIDPDGDCWDPVQHRVWYTLPLFVYLSTHLCHRCMEHSLHLGVGHVLSHITPIDPRKTHGTQNDNSDDNSDDESDSEYGGIISGALHKLLGLIKQVHLFHCHYHIY